MRSRHHCLVWVLAPFGGRSAGLEHPPVVLRHHLAETAHLAMPATQDALGRGRIGLGEVLAQCCAHRLRICVVELRLQIDHFGVQVSPENVIGVVDERRAS